MPIARLMPEFDPGVVHRSRIGASLRQSRLLRLRLLRRLTSSDVGNTAAKYHLMHHCRFSQPRNVDSRLHR